MSSLAESISPRRDDHHERPSREHREDGRIGKRKERSPTNDDVRNQQSRDPSRSEKRSRRYSGNYKTNGGPRIEQNGDDNLFHGPHDKERWKTYLSHKRSQSFSSRDPLGLDPNPPPLPASPPSSRSNGYRAPLAIHRPRLPSQKHTRDRIIPPPKHIMCPDPLHLDEDIEAYKNKANGGSKAERMAERFRYGNYNRYYGYREVATDPRYPLMRREWVEGRDCLDVGCNTGQVTLLLTKDFHPRMMIGIDIDLRLIRIAKKNVRHYLTDDICQREGFPMSLPILYGPIAAPAILDKDSAEQPREFPYNIAFLECDYVPKENIQNETEEFDTIFALSITKWIHVNHGDEGLKRFFQRTYRHLRPGGLLILEPQEWSSYNKGKVKGKMTHDMKEIFKGIKIKPEDFQAYLLSPEVGFESCEKIELPFKDSVAAGFQRCLFVFKKPSPV